jgi:cyclic pyranopterin phosphate synthase
MPETGVQFLPKTELLTFEEITRFTRVAASLGIKKIRLTGGEPLVRAGLPDLVGQLSEVDGIEDLALTTNGLLLSEYAEPLRDAGMKRLNISLDGLSEKTFQRISRRTGLQKVLDGIEKAIDVGFKNIRLNAVSIAGITESEIVPLAKYAQAKDLELRFIEFMPLDADESWENQKVLSGESIKQVLESEFGELNQVVGIDPSQPSVDYEFEVSGARIGFINPVTQPFCSNCNRLRITSEGQIRNCLFSTTEWDVRRILRGTGSDKDIEELMRDCVTHKKIAHGIDTDHFQRPEKSMFQIGG